MPEEVKASKPSSSLRAWMSSATALREAKSVIPRCRSLPGPADFVDDDAEGLVAVSGAQGFAVLAEQVELVGGHLVVKIGAGEVEAIFAPGVQAGFVAALEQGGGGIALAHLGGQGFGIGAGGGGDHLYLDTGVGGVRGGQGLPGFVGFGFEVEEVHLALLGRGDAGHEGQRQDEDQGKQFLHIMIHSLFDTLCGAQDENIICDLTGNVKTLRGLVIAGIKKPPLEGGRSLFGGGLVQALGQTGLFPIGGILMDNAFAGSPVHGAMAAPNALASAVPASKAASYFFMDMCAGHLIIRLRRVFFDHLDALHRGLMFAKQFTSQPFSQQTSFYHVLP